MKSATTEQSDVSIIIVTDQTKYSDNNLTVHKLLLDNL